MPIGTISTNPCSSNFRGFPGSSCIWRWTAPSAQLAELKALLERLRSASAKELGSLEVTAQTLPETNWEESWKDSYPPQEVGRSLIVLPCWNADETRGPGSP